MKAVRSVRTGDFHSNLSFTDNSALKSLKTYDYMDIENACKGSGVVIMSKDIDIKEAIHQL